MRGRLGWGLLGAYAAAATVLGAWGWLREWSARRVFELMARVGGQPRQDFGGWGDVFRDFGVDLSPLERLAIRIGDLGGAAWGVAAGLAAASGLVVALLWRSPSGERASRLDGPDGPRRPAKARAPMACAAGSVAVVLLAVGVTEGFERSTVKPPPIWPWAALFAMQVALAAGSAGLAAWRVLRGPRRISAGLLGLIGVVPLCCWAGAGAYAYLKFDRRQVPSTPLMRWAKTGGSALIDAIAAAERPVVAESPRLLMRHDAALRDPAGDLDAMDQHVARMREELGSKATRKIHWVRGPIRRLGLQGLSVNGVAVGSEASPGDWATGGYLDRHELAHATIDQVKAPDNDAPFVLHEGWAEARSGRTPLELAEAARQARAGDPRLTLAALFGPDWYYQDSGPVYPIGGALVDYLTRTYGVGRFLRFYDTCRPGNWESTCLEAFGEPAAEVEAKFWAEVDRLAPPPKPR